MAATQPGAPEAVFLAGPIEYWWDTPEHSQRFNSDTAQLYRKHRDNVRDYFVARNYLVYSPHNAFKGPWNEKMQGVNDFVLGLSDIVVDLTPDWIPGIVRKGTDHEMDIAREAGKFIIKIPPFQPDDSIERDEYRMSQGWRPTFSTAITDMILETRRLTNAL